MLPVRSSAVLAAVQAVLLEGSEPREKEPRQPNKAYQGLLMVIGPCFGFLGCLGSPSRGSNGFCE